MTTILDLVLIGGQNIERLLDQAVCMVGSCLSIQQIEVEVPHCMEMNTCESFSHKVELPLIFGLPVLCSFDRHRCSIRDEMVKHSRFLTLN